MHFIPTTQTQLDRLKRRAKSLRDQFERLGHARDAAARELGYSDFHHALHCASLTASNRAASASAESADDARVIAFAIEHLKDLLTGDAAVDLGNLRVQAAMNDFQGLRVAGLLAKGTFAENPSSYFDGALTDFNAFHGEDFPSTVSNRGPRQRERGYALWAALLEDSHSAKFHTLYSYAFIKVFGSYAAGLAQMSRNEPAYAVSDRLLTVMQVVLQTRGVDEALDFIQEQEDEFMPEDMNINVHTKAVDTEHRSSWWSRIQGMVSIEMTGVCSVLPFDMIASHVDSGATERLPFAPLYSPKSAAIRESYVDVAKARWAELAG